MAGDAAAAGAAGAGAAPSATEVGALVIFLLSVAGVVLLVLMPLTLRVPLPARLAPRGAGAGARLRVPVPHWLAPPLGVLVMLAAGCLDGRGLLNGIRGDASIQPYSILILFLSLAYMASALDQTGAFSWLALKMTKAASTGPRLFALHSLLAGAVTIATSNDVVVMSLTPIVYTQAAASGADPIPYLAAEFAAANLWSMALYIGNPTNIIVAQAFNMSFLDYSKWMLAPTVAAGLSAAGLLYLLHRRQLPGRLTLPDIPPASVLSDGWGAALITVDLAACLALLAAAPTIGFPLWAITLACAGVVCAYCSGAYVALPRARRRRLQGQGAHRSQAALLPGGGAGDVPSSSRHCGAGGAPVNAAAPDAVAYFEAASSEAGKADVEAAAAPAAAGMGLAHTGLADVPLNDSRLMEQRLAGGKDPGAALELVVGPRQAQAAGPASAEPRESAEQQGPGAAGATNGGAAAAAPPDPGAAAAAAAGGLRAALAARRPTFWGPFLAVPWDVVPLVLGFFILVEGLSANGWVDKLGSLLGGSARSLAPGLWCLGAVSVVLANLINNQPMTILVTRACLTPAFAAAAAAPGGASPAAAAAAAGRNLRAALFAVVVGSNTAACFSVIGALAGIMWVAIIRQRGVKVSYPRFSALILPAGAAATVAALLVLWCEFAYAPY